ncbi:mycofactocin biosynthesis glycosyltransferase MftF [Actinosynnema sp. NPDC023794]
MSELWLRLDGGTRVLAGGRVVLGGSPYRVMRLSAAGAKVVRSWLDGEPVGDDPARRSLAQRLVRAGMVHPVYKVGLTTADVTAVTPVRDQPGELRTVDGVAASIVVDDGSARRVPGAAVRHPVARGPAAARNAGAALVRTELVAFLDADVHPDPGWLDAVLPHFADPEVALVAPRVRSVPGDSTLARYELVRSPLDLGTAPGPVRPGARISYMPSAAIVMRASVLREMGGFDESLRFGEDVDLVWRMAAAGHLVRYEPASTVAHEPRSTWQKWLRQRFDYGTGAAPLGLRHGPAVTPVKMSPWSALAWALAAVGLPAAGVGVALGTAALLPRKLKRFEVPEVDSLRLAIQGHLGAGTQAADAITRVYGPVAMPLMALSKRGRRLLAASLARHLVEWRDSQVELDPARFLGLRVVDDLAYGCGVWWGCVKHRTVQPLLPELVDWPGKLPPR